MRKWLAPIVIVLACAAVYLMARYQRSATSGTGPRPGQLAPELSLQDLNGKPLKLADFRGKVVLLNFWATWCEPCRHEIPEFIQMQNNLHGLQVVGISLDDETGPVRSFYTDFKVNYPVAVGDASLAQRYGGVLGLPISFIVGCDGRVSSRYIGEVRIPEITADINSLLKSASCAPN